jgi:hypothetical protein
LKQLKILISKYIRIQPPAGFESYRNKLSQFYKNKVCLSILKISSQQVFRSAAFAMGSTMDQGR